MTDDRPDPSKRLVMQRVHNRILEYLEFVSSPDAQREFERRHPTSRAVWDVVEEWNDWKWAHAEPEFGSPAFSNDERRAVAEFDQIWRPFADAWRDLPDDLESASQTPEFTRLRAAAERALAVLRVRGRLPEDEEIVSP